MFLLTGLLLAGTGARAATVSGSVRSTDGKRLSGIFVTARDESLGVAVTVTTDRDGRFRIPNLDTAMYLFRIHQSGYEDATVVQAVDEDVTGLTFVMQSAEGTPDALPASTFLGMLPDGKEKRRFIIDCLGCHSLNKRILFKEDGTLLDMPAWKASVEKMLSFSGHNTPFPIMAPDRLAGPTAEFVARYVTDASLAEAAAQHRDFRAPTDAYTVTEYDLPEQQDFPHDGVIYMLNPSNGTFATKEIPIGMANPRALDVDAEGNWWILCGAPKKIARYTVATDKWDFYDIGMYPHSIMVDDDKRVWFNGHFTNNPIMMGFVDGARGGVETMEVPAVNMPPEEGGPIPYGMRVGPDGTVWSTELAGNRLIKYVPDTKEMKAYEMPSPHSGPRRLDVAPDGIVWIPEFTTGKLARFDPDAETFTEYDFPTSNSLPYCARVNPSTGVVWISQCANDAIARFDPSREEFVEFRLPTRVAFIRHLDIDPLTGDVWAAYSHSPGLHPRIVRLQMH
jgi:virginiamycin B lyase